MKKLIYLLLIYTLTVLIFASVLIEHIPPVSYDKSKEISLSFQIQEGMEELGSGKILYRETGKSTYSAKDIELPTISGSQVTVILPVLNSNNGIEYFFEFTTKNGQITTLPAESPENNPFRITTEISVKASEGFVKLSPEEPVSFGDDLTIALSYFAISDKIDKDSVVLTVNGKDVTHLAQKTEYVILYTLKKPLPGKTSFSLSAKGKDGTTLVSPQWESDIKGKPAFDLPYEMKGDLYITSSIKKYSADDESAYDEDAIRRASLLFRMDGRENWFKFGSRIYLSSLNSSRKQPYNRYTFLLGFPHLNITLGDKTTTYSQYSLNKNISGVSADLEFDAYRLNITYGRNLKMVEGNLNDGYLTTAGTFSRKTFAVRQEIGLEGNFVWGFDLVSSTDDDKSLSEEEYTRDSTIVATPKDNLIIGTDFISYLFKKKLKIGANVNMSLYNHNIFGGAISKDEINEEYDVNFPFNPEDIEWLFILNKNIQPLLPGRSNLAYEIYSSLNLSRNYLTFSYSEIGPAYYSIASSYLNNDQRKLTVSDNMILWRNQLILSIGFSAISDNIMDTKDFTTKSNTIFATSLIRPATLPYFRFGINHTTSGSDNDADTESKYLSLNIGSGYRVEMINYPTEFKIDFWNNSSDSESESDSLISESNLNNISLSSTTDFEQLPLVAGFKYTLGMTSSDNYTSETDYNRHVITLFGKMRFLEERLLPELRFNYSTDDSENKFNKISFDMGSSYKLFPGTELTASLGFSNLDNDEDNGYSLIDASLKIRHNF